MYQSLRKVRKNSCSKPIISLIKHGIDITVMKAGYQFSSSWTESTKTQKSENMKRLKRSELYREKQTEAILYSDIQ